MSWIVINKVTLKHSPCFDYFNFFL